VIDSVIVPCVDACWQSHTGETTNPGRNYFARTIKVLETGYDCLDHGMRLSESALEKLVNIPQLGLEQSRAILLTIGMSA
jgi:hypothetical protein